MGIIDRLHGVQKDYMGGANMLHRDHRQVKRRAQTDYMGAQTCYSGSIDRLHGGGTDRVFLGTDMLHMRGQRQVTQWEACYMDRYEQVTWGTQTHTQRAESRDRLQKVGPQTRYMGWAHKSHMRGHRQLHLENHRQVTWGEADIDSLHGDAQVR